MTRLWKDIRAFKNVSSRLACCQRVYVDFLDVMAFRKFASMQSFNKEVYKLGQQQGIFQLAIGPTNYHRYRMLLDSQEMECSDLLASRATILQLEYHVDQTSLYGNPFVLSFIHECMNNGMAVYVVNNTYYTDEQLRVLLINIDVSLQHVVIGEVVDQQGSIYVTTERKSSFLVEQIEYDVRVRNEIDLEELYYEEVDEHFYFLRKAVAQSEFCQENIYFRLGAVMLGPLMSSFVATVIKDLKKKNISFVAPLMREGDLLVPLIENHLNSRNDTSMTCEPLFVSRKATYIPALSEQVTASEIIHYFATKLISIEDLCKLLEIPTFSYHDTSINIFSLKQQGTEAYRQFVNHVELHLTEKKLQSFIQGKRQLLQLYLDRVFDKQTEIATIDIGFNGTIQESLEKVSEGVNFHHYLLFGREGIFGKLKQGISISTYINSLDFPYVTDIIRCVHVFEQFVIGSKGSTLDYELANSNVIPICEDVDYTKEEIDARKKIKDGIIYFQQIFLSISNLEKDDTINKLPSIGKTLHRLIHKPLKEESEAIGKLMYSENFGSMEYNPLISFDKLNKYTVNYVYQSLNASTLSTKILWPQGVLSLIDSNYSMRDVRYNHVKEIHSKISFYMDFMRVSRVAVYGAGEVAKQVLHTLNVFNIQPIYLIDRNEKLHGTFVERIKIISPSQLLEKSVQIIVIASYTFGEEIERDLQQLYGHRANEVTIIRIDQQFHDEVTNL